MKKSLSKNLIGIAIFALLMVLFTFIDLPVAKLVYTPDSSFGRFFEIIGTLPLLLVGVFCAVGVILTTERKLHIKSIISYLLGVMLFSIFSMYGIGCIEHQIASAKTPITIFTIVWTAICIILCLKTVKNGYSKELRQASIIGSVGCFVSTLVVGQIKDLFARQRFHTFVNPDTEFTYWFQIQKTSEVISEINDSFPSGHAAQSATSLFITLLPSFINSQNKDKLTKIMFLASSAFTLCVMISRMVLGMHFGTDVIFGAAITLISMRITQSFICKKTAA